jgi:sterol desaturase/sphingolipid hydroxylase (fatty acid hydroxylase superfamily)
MAGSGHAAHMAAPGEAHFPRRPLPFGTGGELPMTIESLATYQPLIVPIMLGLTVLLETARPLAQSDEYRWRHARRNLGITLLAFVAFAALGGVKATAAAFVTTARAGLLNLVDLPWVVRIALSFAAIDFVNYLGHRLQHGLPWLWRFHRVHHADARLDATSSLRFHPVEAAVEVSYQTAAVLLFGIQLDAIVLFDTVLLAILYVQHANVDWPDGLDRIARLLVVTPHVHHVHHSRDRRLTNSNFADLFTFWDRALGTYEEAPRDRRIAYGLAEFDDDAYQTVTGMAMMPFAPLAPGAAVADSRGAVTVSEKGETYANSLR